MIKITLLGDGISAQCESCKKILRASSRLATIGEIIALHECDKDK